MKNLNSNSKKNNFLNAKNNYVYNESSGQEYETVKNGNWLNLSYCCFTGNISISPHKIPSKTFLYCPIKLHRLKITPNKSLNWYIFHDRISSGNMLKAVFTSVIWGVLQRKYLMIWRTKVIFVQKWNDLIKK